MHNSDGLIRAMKDVENTQDPWRSNTHFTKYTMTNKNTLFFKNCTQKKQFSKNTTKQKVRTVLKKKASTRHDNVEY